VTYDGTFAFSNAMHIHSSFSEQNGSMDAQLSQAAQNVVDVLWWTDHDHRMDGIGYRQWVSFTSLTGEVPPAGQGKAWAWKPAHSIPSNTATTGYIAATGSPSDPVPGSSLFVSAKPVKNASSAYYGFTADTHAAGWNERDNLTGQSLLIDVLLSPGWGSGYLEFLVASSYHEAQGGYPAGDYALSYRFIPGTGALSYGGTVITPQGVITGIVIVPVSNTSGWFTAALTPSADIAGLWPLANGLDFALWGLTLNGVSTGDYVSGYFDYLRFERTLSGGEFLTQQQLMMAEYGPLYPGVVQQQGLEVSWLLPHVNWFGNVTMPDYGSTKPSQYPAFLAGTVIPDAHAAGALVSYNHPFGYNAGPPLSQSAQDALLTQVGASLLANRALGADLLEVGYELRSGVQLADHLVLWDIMSRNAIFLTGNGTSDDHFGQGWLTGNGTSGNNWTTSVWAASTGQADLLAALLAGRAWCGSLSAFGQGSFLDLLVDGSVPMGKVSVSSLTSRSLSVIAAGIPASGSVQVLRGAVDYAGRSGLASNAVTIGSFSAAAFASGPASLTVDTSTDGYYRVVVLDALGNIVAASNPVWLLRSVPPNGIPAARQA
jgi:hypothetical protein